MSNVYKWTLLEPVLSVVEGWLTLYLTFLESQLPHSHIGLLRAFKPSELSDRSALEAGNYHPDILDKHKTVLLVQTSAEHTALHHGLETEFVGFLQPPLDKSIAGLLSLMSWVNGQYISNHKYELHIQEQSVSCTYRERPT